MKKQFGLAKVTFSAVALSAVMLPARAQNVVEGAAPLARTIYFYNAGPGLGANKLGTWGNGEAETSELWTYNEDGTLKVRSRNFYEGARIDLAEPLDLAAYRKDGYVRLRLHFKVLKPVAGGEGQPGGMPGMPGGMPGETGAPRQRRMFSIPPSMRAPAPRVSATGVSTVRVAQAGEMPLPRTPRRRKADVDGAPGDAPELMGGPGGDVAEEPEMPQQESPIQQIRVAFLHDKGVTSGTVAIDLKATEEDQDEEGWRTFSFPVRDMRATPNVEGPVRRVLVSSDKDDSFWLAQIALVSENGKMTASIRRPTDEPGAQIATITVKPGPVKLVADVESGIADAIIEWDFDADKVGNLPPPALNPPALEGAPEGVPGGAPVEAAPLEGGEAPAVPIGPRIDAVGLQATFEYPNEEQNYRVEVTVRDRRGRKAAIKASILVQVRG